MYDKCCSSTLPIGWDDPSDCTELLQLLMDIFHQGGSGNINNKGGKPPLTVPLTTINDEKLRKDLRYVRSTTRTCKKK